MRIAKLFNLVASHFFLSYLFWDILGCLWVEAPKPEISTEN